MQEQEMISVALIQA
ncbi:hypothetical protein PCC21_036100 [Pectobacterium carotovorum subsp. carotovorum PCC21]|nr:hypothetical protein PCC21_036100 [Pectobacterium carotovorum subsp. carotovorum PCC21]